MRRERALKVDASLLPKQRKPVPHAFVLDAISALSPYTRPMFGCLAIYVKDKIVLILRDKPKSAADNGVWLATTQEHHQSLRREFPNMRSIQVLGKQVTGWQVLPVDAPDFESGWRRARHTVRPRSRFTENCWRACLLIVRLSRVRLPFAFGFDDRAELLAAAPDVYYVTDHYLNYSAVLVRLSRVTPDVLRDLLGIAHKFVTASDAGRSSSRNRRKPV
jgi:hypothetical protein